MGREAVDKIIDGTNYTITQFGATKSMKLLTRLSKIVGEPLGEIASGFDSKKNLLDQEFDGKMIGHAVKALVDNLDEDHVVDTLKQLLSCVLHNGATLDKTFDIHFQGRLGHMFKVVFAALEVQYKDFLGGIGELVSLNRVASSSERQTSTGLSGDPSLTM